MDIDEENAITREPIGTADGVAPIVDPAAGPADLGHPVADAADPTGDERVDEALARLDELGRTAVAEHVEIFDDVRHRLQDVLTSIDQDGPRPPVPPRP